MTTPKRIQRRRTPGWRMPANTAYVGRPTKFGNPFGYHQQMGGLVHYGPNHLERFGRAWDFEGRISGDGNRHDMWFSQEDVVETYVRWGTRAELVELFRLTLTRPTPGMLLSYPSRGGRFLKVSIADIRRDLAGKNLACWCPIGEPCHADVLLEIANAPVVAELVTA
ncbi:DUF4326 domain-containing protein [Micromonospora sp. WMMD980]|uniref:DUF4326 domain-containing protein n=1 Tax=Micromonospora sp. WMMD980 TaxID=3016088 RepID=UPI002415BA56|nr:DUF4326 domain-containing protein [Micromonospora sp. WMMD980]MDG4798958.1 DUF4326 domain-containing protein [Micromonospora sp. WMMD980]MDG4798969.1 DUF4326 domain-containing protein [Micromonospora sp. WMMD980]MDG4799024.1 DUF4326 domain-containing protein [Micromonospora sp. WMMD980]